MWHGPSDAAVSTPLDRPGGRRTGRQCRRWRGPVASALWCGVHAAIDGAPPPPSALPFHIGLGVVEHGFTSVGPTSSLLILCTPEPTIPIPPPTPTGPTQGRLCAQCLTQWVYSPWDACIQLGGSLPLPSFASVLLSSTNPFTLIRSADVARTRVRRGSPPFLWCTHPEVH